MRGLEAISAKSLKSLVGEEEVRQSNEISTLQEGAGKNGTLKANGNFECRPHPKDDV
jgi:hypothetical protein